MGVLQGFVAALRVGGAMIYPLLLLTVVAVVVILEKAFVFATRTRLPTSLLEVLETYGFAWDDLEQRVGRVRPQNYFGHFFRVILENRQRPAWWVAVTGIRRPVCPRPKSRRARGPATKRR